MKHAVCIFLLLIIVAVWGWTFVVVKDAIDEFGVVSFLALRFVIAACCMAPFSVGKMTRTDAAVGAGIGVVLGAAYFFQTLGLSTTTVTNAGVITGLFVVFAPLTNWVVFRVKTDWVLWLAIAASCWGLIQLTGAMTGGMGRGDLFVLVCAVCFGLHIALLDRFAKHHSAVGLACGQIGTAALMFLIASLVFQPPRWPSPSIFFALVLTGVVATAAGFFIQTYVQQRLKAVETAIIIMMEPIFAALFGFLLAGDRLTLWQWAGAGLMVMAFFLTQLYPLIVSPRPAKPVSDD
jgi:drug/metabolite transporter (DMT)-like permease